MTTNDPCARPMPDTPAPSTDDPVCGATTRVFGKFRTCELPSGHEGRHESHLGGETVWWENNGPECEHGHLARVCVICELIAAEARVAELEASNAALVAERHEAISNYHTTLESLVGIMDEVSARFFDSDSRREWKERRHLYTSIIERKKEAPDAGI